MKIEEQDYLIKTAYEHGYDKDIIDLIKNLPKKIRSDYDTILNIAIKRVKVNNER